MDRDRRSEIEAKGVMALVAASSLPCLAEVGLDRCPISCKLMNNQGD